MKIKTNFKKNFFLISIILIFIILSMIKINFTTPYISDSPTYLWGAMDIINLQFPNCTFQEGHDYRYSYFLYSFFIALFYKAGLGLTTSGTLVSLLFSSLSLWVIYKIIFQISDSQKISLVGTLLTAINPVFLEYPILIFRRSQFMFLFLIFTYIILRLLNKIDDDKIKILKYISSISFVILMGCLTRFDFIIYYPFTFIFFIYFLQKKRILKFKYFIPLIISAALLATSMHIVDLNKKNIKDKEINIIKRVISMTSYPKTNEKKGENHKNIVKYAIKKIHSMANNIFRNFYIYFLPKIASPFILFLCGAALVTTDDKKIKKIFFLFILLLWTIFTFSFQVQTKELIRYYVHLTPIFIIISTIGIQGLISRIKTGNNKLIFSSFLAFILIFLFLNNLKVYSAIFRDPDYIKQKIELQSIKKFSSLNIISEKVISNDRMFTYLCNAKMNNLSNFRTKENNTYNIEAIIKYLFVNNAQMLILRNRDVPIKKSKFYKLFNDNRLNVKNITGNYFIINLTDLK